MKRTLIALLITALLATLCPGGALARDRITAQDNAPSQNDAPSQDDASSQGAASTTLLVYMCGSNNLQEAGCVDLYEMAGADVGENTNIAVLAGGSYKWEDEDLSGETLNLVTIRGKYFTDVEDWGKGSMADADTLLAFLEYGLTEFPADRTIVVLWNHGMGSEGGVCYDDMAGDVLTLNEINEVLYALDDDIPNYHIDIFGCDACMMATYEMAALLSHYNIDYYVASEEVEPGVGWYYTPWLQALDAHPDMSNEALCGLIVDSFMDDNYTYSADDYFQLSAVRLADMQQLCALVEGFAGSMTSAVTGGKIAQVRRGRSRVYTFGSFCDGSWDMVDLGAALDAWSEFDPENAGEASRVLKSAVVANRYSDNLDACCGLSIMVPQDTTADYEDYRDGYDLSFYLPNWVAFVDTYVAMLTGTDYAFESQTPTVMESGCPVTSSGGSLWDSPWLSMFDEDDSYTITEDDYGFSMQLSEADMDNLDYVEGMLMLDTSDDELISYVDFGTMQNNSIDWKTGKVYSLFDGSWPMLGDQPVAMYDQTVTERGRRSLIPVKLNGEYTYLVVMFRDNEAEGQVLGANAGYDENGLPIRQVTKLNEGDSVIPVYTMYYVDADADEDADFEETEFDGDEITWHEGMTVSYVSLLSEDYEEDDEEPIAMMFCFVLNDIFGGFEMSDVISFEL